MNRRIAVRGVAMHEGKLLCVKLKAYGGREAREFWCLPGGGIEDGEALIPALEREMLEETGIKANVGSLVYIQQFSFEGKEQFEFFFHITNAADYLSLDISNATHAEEEIGTIDFVDPKAAYILPEFLTTEPIDQQISNSLPTKIFNYL